jgi:hypothetical protein
MIQLPGNLKLAQKEFRTIVRLFAKREAYVSRHLGPDYLRVIVSDGKAWLEFEMHQTGEKLTFCSWDGAILVYMPYWRSREEDIEFWRKQELAALEWDRAFWRYLLPERRRVTGLTNALQMIVERVVVVTHGRAWKDKKTYRATMDALAPARAGVYDGVMWDFPRLSRSPLPGGWAPRGYVFCEYPYVIDVMHMRHMRPDVAWGFRNVEDTDLKWFLLTIIERLNSSFPGVPAIPTHLRQEIAGMILSERLDRATESTRMKKGA